MCAGAADNGANEKLYGRKLSAEEIVRGGKAGAPGAARKLVSVLRQKSPRNLSDKKSLE